MPTYQQLDDLSDVSTLTEIDDDQSAVLLTATGEAVRWTDDGTNPTSTRGFVLAVNKPFVYPFGAVSKLKFIQAAPGAVLDACIHPYYSSGGLTNGMLGADFEESFAQDEGPIEE